MLGSRAGEQTSDVEVSAALVFVFDCGGQAGSAARPIGFRWDQWVTGRRISATQPGDPLVPPILRGPFRPLLDPTDHQPRPFPVFRHLKWRTPTTLVNQTSVVDDTRPHDTLSPNRKSETDRSQKNAPAHRPMRIICCAVPNFLIVFTDMVCSYLQILSLSAPVSAGSRLGSCRTKGLVVSTV